MDCRDARAHLLDERRHELEPNLRGPLEAHLAGCEDCRRERAAERELSAALDARLPRRRAPEALRRSIEARWDASRVAPRSRRALYTLAAMAAGALIAVVAMVSSRGRGGEESRAGNEALVAEAVNDHLRILYGAHPVEVESGGIHQVKPWFEGRVDFAPVVPFGGDDDFPLQGGAVAYFVDRKAAAFVFKRRLHVITLLVFPAEGLAWPAAPAHPIGTSRGTSSTSRGFHVLVWRKGDLGYALVSDVDPRDLDALAAKVEGG
jgi:anti-sigma factor RsiW